MIIYSTDPIPVKPYVKRFIESGNTIKPFILQEIFHLLTKDQSREVVEYTQFNKSYSDTVKLSLPEKVFLEQGWHIPQQNVDRCNSLLEGYIKMFFECELEANIRRSERDMRKFKINEMIIDLRQKFGLDEENMPFETIKKSLQRFCERENVDIQGIKIFAKSVPKKRITVTISSHFITRKEFLQKFNIASTTYARMKNERGQLSVFKNGKEDYVNLNLSELPPIYTIVKE